jgi:hypothetical protein
MVLRRITIDSTRLSVAVTPFARWVNTGSLSANVAPEPPSACPFQARRVGATASRVNRALYGRNKPIRFQIPRQSPK